jgi:hypothetical protein
MNRAIRDAYIKGQRDVTMVAKQWPNTSSLEEKQLIRTRCKTDLRTAEFTIIIVHYWRK